MNTSRTLKMGLTILSLVGALAACERASETSTGADQAQSGAGNDTMPTSPTPSPTPTVWTACATENGVCVFDGTADVRYGFGGVYITNRATYSQMCSNAAFGSDPVVGVVKSCEYANLVAAPPIDDTGWVYCASENEHCNFSGLAEVRYGVNRVFTIQDSTDGVDCNNSRFGDPVVGTVKHCDYRLK